MIKKPTSYRYLWMLLIAFLVATVFTSCSGRTASPTLSPTDVMETSMAFVKTEIVETLTAASTSTPTFSLPTPSPIPATQIPYFSTPLDRHNPEAVLRAYFDAWDRQDWTAKDSLESHQRAPEPVGFVNILEIKKISSSPTECIYKVRFDIEVKVQGGSMHSGQYLWTYYLTWDPNRDTWYIRDYGGV